MSCDYKVPFKNPTLFYFTCHECGKPVDIGNLNSIQEHKYCITDGRYNTETHSYDEELKINIHYLSGYLD